MGELFNNLEFKDFSLKSRIFSSNISGRFDNYDRSGSRPRLFAALLERSGSGGASLNMTVESIERIIAGG